MALGYFAMRWSFSSKTSSLFLISRMNFTPEETVACRRLVEMAWEEDLGPECRDLTTQTIITPDLEGRAVFVARGEGVVAGLPAVELVLNTPRTPLLRFQPLKQDGDRVQAGDRLATVAGIMQSILMAERTALNFLQRLSGIATLTRRYVDAVAGLPCQILDTRKTTPGWRLLEKYAVRCGGGHNHRLGLYDGILIKDNHLAALNRTGLGIYDAVERAQQIVGSPVPMEIEVDNLDQLEHALACRPQIILLDNMSREGLREAVRRRELKERSGPEA